MLEPKIPKIQEPSFQGIYGTYKITQADQFEVKCYRLSVLCCGITFSIGLAHWILFGAKYASLWLIPFTISLGLALKWIHIYMRSLHLALQVFWVLGCLGLGILTIKFGINNLLSTISSDQIWTIAIDPLFAALTGLGFKEFFCFRRIEAIGLTLLLPIALLGYLTSLLNGTVVFSLLSCSAILLLILSIRKFGLEAAADVGDKSIFEYLNHQQTIEI